MRGPERLSSFPFHSPLWSLCFGSGLTPPSNRPFPRYTKLCPLASEYSSLMTQRTFTLCILLIVIGITRAAPRSFYSISWLQSIHVSPIPTDAESELAAGGRIPLGCADISSLELIPGISDTIAISLLEKREAIQLAFRKTSIESSLQIARGIGPKNASKIARYLDGERQCVQGESYHFFSPERF